MDSLVQCVCVCLCVVGKSVTSVSWSPETKTHTWLWSELGCPGSSLEPLYECVECRHIHKHTPWETAQYNESKKWTREKTIWNTDKDNPISKPADHSRNLHLQLGFFWCAFLISFGMEVMGLFLIISSYYTWGQKTLYIVIHSIIVPAT